MKRLLKWVFVKPFHQAFYLTKSVPGNARNLFVTGARGASRNIHRYAPLTPGVNASEIQRMDQWWRKLSSDERLGLYEQHQDWVLSHQIYAEVCQEDAKAPITRRERKVPSFPKLLRWAQVAIQTYVDSWDYLSYKLRRFLATSRVWSLSLSPERRASAFHGQRGMFYLWSVIWITGVSSSILMWLINSPGPMFYFMFTAFFVFTSSDLASSRVSLAQLVYGRRVSVWELLKPLPKKLETHPERDQRYHRLYDQVSMYGVSPVSPVRKEFRKQVWNWTDNEASS